MKIELDKVAGNKTQLPKINTQQIDEIAVIGRSNVGKSSLINHLFLNKGLARVSAKPGKTQTINFFKIDDKWYLVDLPGYGFAKTSAQEKKRWESLIDHYFQSERPIKYILILLDSRREVLTTIDAELIQWVQHLGYKPIFVITKTDKLSKNQKYKHTQKIQSQLSKLINDKPIVIPYSIREKEGRESLLKRIT